ncbi:MAG: beta-lactamase family protein [Ruminococcaceae bacterium]|nr:beta-lactamase family protein [Oscillospiraceae bacterium]
MNFDKLDRLLTHLVEDKGVPGVEIAIHQGGNEIYRGFEGFADREAERIHSGRDIYNLYSMSKVITCTAALRLFEEGRFLMTDPLAAYIPEFANMTVREMDQKGNEILRPAKKQITVADLFTMSAGLNYNYWNDATRKVQAETEGRCPTRAFVGALAATPLQFEPGTHWNYSLCHDVLGGLIEVISGMTFGEYLKKNIFDPVGMPDTGFKINEEQQSRLAGHYRFDDELGYAVRIEPRSSHFIGSEYESGGAGLFSTVADYMRFAESMTAGGVTPDGYRILCKNTIDLMRTNHLDPVRMVDYDWIQLAGYGYGLGVRTMVDRSKGALSSIGEFGWDGAAGSWVLMDPARELTVVYGQHMLNGLHPYILPRLRNVIYSCIE